MVRRGRAARLCGDAGSCPKCEPAAVVAVRRVSCLTPRVSAYSCERGERGAVACLPCRVSVSRVRSIAICDGRARPPWTPSLSLHAYGSERAGGALPRANGHLTTAAGGRADDQNCSANGSLPTQHELTRGDTHLAPGSPPRARGKHEIHATAHESVNGFPRVRGEHRRIAAFLTTLRGSPSRLRRAPCVAALHRRLHRITPASAGSTVA